MGEHRDRGRCVDVEVVELDRRADHGCHDDASAGYAVDACGGPKPELPQQHSGSKPDTSGIEINGDASDPVNKLAIEAIADLQKYWGEEYPKTYEGDYQPVKGGFFAVLPSSGDLPPCAAAASDISGNAF